LAHIRLLSAEDDPFRYEQYDRPSCPMNARRRSGSNPRHAGGPLHAPLIRGAVTTGPAVVEPSCGTPQIAAVVTPPRQRLLQLAEPEATAITSTQPPTPIDESARGPTPAFDPAKNPSLTGQYQRERANDRPAEATGAR
jgi:hypothetical protein